MAKGRQDAPAEGSTPLRARIAGAVRGSASALAAWIGARPLRHGLLLLTCVLAVIGGAAWGTLAFMPESRPAYMRRLAQAFSRLDAGDHRAARSLAAELLADRHFAWQDRGGPYLVLGQITLVEADAQVNPAKRQLLCLVAARYLDEGRKHGFPATRTPQALAMLGRALHDAGRYAESVPALSEALAAGETSDPELHVLLADSYLHASPPRLADALAHNRLYLASPALPADKVDAGRLLTGRILLIQGDYSAALEVAERIAPDSPHRSEAEVLAARIRLAALQTAPIGGSDKRAECLAIVEWMRSIEQRYGGSAITAQASLLIGMAQQQLSDRAAAIAQYEQVRRKHFGKPEALAATIYQANLVLADRPQEAVVLYKRALNHAGAPEAYENDWLPTAALQKELEGAIDGLAEQEEFAAGLELASALPPFFPTILARQRQASLHRAWAQHLERRAANQRGSTADLSAAEARYHWRMAGLLARELAELRIATRHYTDDLAAAADDFRRGQGYEQAIAVYRELLKQDLRRGHPEALVGLGESLLATGQVAEAAGELGRCHELYPTHPATYRARLLASYVRQEQRQLAEAKELLLDNLYRYALAPQSGEWRDSLFALGALLYREGLELETQSRQAGVDAADGELQRAGLALLEQSYAAFQEAVKTLREAVERYPSDPQATLARYRIAEASRHSAKLPRKRLSGVTIETSRISLTRQMQEHLEAAIEGYRGLIASLGDQQDAQHARIDAAILRNSYFGRADALADLGRFEEAIEAYSAATNRYQHEPASLEAYVQIASCYRRLNRPIESRGTLEQARVVLGRIRPDADFVQTTRLNRQEWTQLLDWLRTL